LVIVDYSEIDDKMTKSLLLNETYKYWSLIQEPKKLKPTNKLYALVGSIQDLFEDVRVEHEKYLDEDFVENLVNRHAENVKKRKECVRLELAISENEKLLHVYDEILQWSIK